MKSIIGLYSKIITFCLFAIVIIASLIEIAKLRELNNIAEATIIEIYKENKVEYCVYDFVSTSNMIIAKDKIRNYRHRNIGDTIKVYYNEENNYEVTEYKKIMENIFTLVIILGVIIEIVIVTRHKLGI